jgi:predicted phage tail protein
MPTEEKVATLVSRLVDEARSLAGAEVELVKARVGAKTSAYKSAAVFFAIAGVLALGAFIALLVGLILSLSTLIGPGYATLAVVGVTLVMAGVLALIGKSRLGGGKP